MVESITDLGGRVLDASVAALVVSGLAALAMVVTRQPTRRRALARAGVLGSLAVIPLAWAHPFGALAWAEPIRVALHPLPDRVAALAASAAGWARPALRAVPAGLLLAYAAGVALGLARLAVGGLGVVWIGRNSRPASEGSQAVYDDLLMTSGGARPVLRVSARTTRPVLLGGLRPTILIPPDLDDPARADPLRLALVHELAHAEASDPWFGLAAELASAAWFWLPTLRWLVRQMRLDQEYLADHRAASRLGPSSRYASTLVEFAAGSAVTGPLREGRPASGSALLGRVLMLVRSPFPVEARPPRWWRGSLAMATLVVVPLAAGLTLRPRLASPSGPPRLAADLAMPRLVLEGAETVSFPIRLPEDFDLRFEVVADGAELARIDVLGHPLAETPREDGPARSHRIALRRRDGRLTLGLDDDPTTRLPGISTDAWFNARGLPGHPTTFLDFHLSPGR